MQLFAHQQKFLDKNVHKGLLVWGCGTGKTLASLKWAEKLPNVDNVLITCPKTLITNWTRTIDKLYGNAGITLNKIGNFCVLRTSSRTFYIMSKEYFKKQNDLENVLIGAVIIDEVHNFSGIKSMMYKTMKKFLKDRNVLYVLGLTGTPYLSTPYNIFAYGSLLGRREYEWTFIYFQQKYFSQVWMGRTRVSIIKPNIEQAMADRIAEIADVVKMQDCADVPESNYSEEYFTLTKDQKKEWKNIYDPNHIVEWTKRHQLCGGGIKGDGYTPDVNVSSHKMDRVIELAGQVKKIIIVCRYTLEINNIAEKLLLENIDYSILDGRTPDKQAILDAANASDKHVLLVNAACSEGWEAKTFDTMVFYSYDFSLKNYVQMRDRIQRIDALQKCNYISLIVEGTIDEDVYKSVCINKHDFHLSIYNSRIDDVCKSGKQSSKRDSING